MCQISAQSKPPNTPQVVRCLTVTLFAFLTLLAETRTVSNIFWHFFPFLVFQLLDHSAAPRSSNLQVRGKHQNLSGSVLHRAVWEA